MKNLLERYRRGIISSEELDKLSEKMNVASDDDMARLLRSQWMEGVGRRRFVNWTSVAAAVLLFVSVGLGVSLLRTKREHQVYCSNEIIVETGDEDQSKVTLPDGTKVVLSVNSILKYSTDFGAASRDVVLCGQAYFDVVKDDERKFSVTADDVCVSVYGTKFNVYAYEGGAEKEISLIDGSIGLKYGNTELKLSPNEKACIDNKTGRIHLFRTDNSLETSWMDERMTFINRPLYQVIDALERRFGVQIECNSGINLMDHYTGSFGERRIDDILDILKIHYKFNYEYENGVIILKN